MGIIFCKKQLREAIVAFKKVLAGEEAWLKVLDELELLNEFEEDPDLSDEYSDYYYYYKGLLKSIQK